MTPAQTVSAVILTVSLAPGAAFAQEAYGEKGWVEDYPAEVVVVEADVYAPVDTTVYVERQVHVAPVVSYGCIMGHGVLQRGTLICPGH